VRGEAADLSAEKSNGPELGTRGLHSEGGGGRGLTARMLSVETIIAFQIFWSTIISSSFEGVDGGRK